MVSDLFSELPNIIQLDQPQAGFYAFPKFIGATDSFALDLLNKKGVACTPGSSFGQKYFEHIRLSFATEEEIIKEAISRIKELVLEIL